jgi:hypothetical protein
VPALFKFFFIPDLREKALNFYVYSMEKQVLQKSHIIIEEKKGEEKGGERVS